MEWCSGGGWCSRWCCCTVGATFAFFFHSTASRTILHWKGNTSTTTTTTTQAPYTGADLKALEDDENDNDSFYGNGVGGGALSECDELSRPRWSVKPEKVKASLSRLTNSQGLTVGPANSSYQLSAKEITFNENTAAVRMG
jgi:hypothetical protein